MTVHTNLEATAIILATGFAGRTWLEAALIVASFAVGTGLHLMCHLLVAIAYGKGIDRMVLTRAGRIDYSGAPPGFVENVLRTAAGASMNALCAIVGYALIANAGWAEKKSSSAGSGHSSAQVAAPEAPHAEMIAPDLVFTEKDSDDER